MTGLEVCISFPSLGIALISIAGLHPELYREINQRYTDEIWDYDLKDFFPSQGKGSEPSTPSRSNGTALSSANANIFIEDEDAFLESLMNAARFFMTSVHDSSLQEAWGRVMQSLMGPLYGPIEGLMSTFARVSLQWQGPMSLASQDTNVPFPFRQTTWKKHSCSTSMPNSTSLPTIPSPKRKTSIFRQTTSARCLRFRVCLSKQQYPYSTPCVLIFGFRVQETSGSKERSAAYKLRRRG